MQRMAETKGKLFPPTPKKEDFYKIYEIAPVH